MTNQTEVKRLHRNELTLVAKSAHVCLQHITHVLLYLCDSLILNIQHFLQDTENLNVSIHRCPEPLSIPTIKEQKQLEIYAIKW